MSVIENNSAAQRGVGDDQGTNGAASGIADGASVTAPVSIAPKRTDAPAKVRILETADRLFYEDGIRTVGIDRLIGESNVTKATFYKHWGSKDRLILHYLEGRHRSVQSLVGELVAGLEDPVAVLRGLTDAISAEIDKPGFRGCPFINAAAEYADPASPAREMVSTHREWYTDTLTELLRDAGHPLPGDAADDLMLARDGAMVGGYAGDSVSASAAFRRTTERVVKEAA